MSGESLGLTSPAADVLDVRATAELIEKGKWTRVGFTIFVALIATVAVAPIYCLAWAVGMVIWDLVMWPFARDTLVLQARTQQAGFRWIAACHFLGATGNAVFPVLTWSTGEPIGMVLATAWVSGAANHLFVYFIGHRLVLAATLAPLTMCALAAPLVTDGPTFSAVVGSVALLALIAAAAMSGFDRHMLARSRAEQAAARIRAEESSQSKSQFLATMSGELRAPLNEIIGYAELIEEESVDERGQDARRIKHSAQNLLRTLNMVADVAKLESGAAVFNLDAVPLKAILKDMQDAIAPLAAASGGVLSITVSEDLGEAELDHMRLHQALLQMATHAFRRAKGKPVEVSARNATRDGRAALEIYVTCGEPALDAEQAARLFDPFASLDDGVLGGERAVGLGFSRDIVRLMGGDIIQGAESGKGGGLLLWLPLKRG